MTVVLFATLILQFGDWLREISGKRWSAVIMQTTAWASGIVMVILGAHAVATQALILPGTDVPLGHLDGWSQVLVGFLASSLASTIVDLRAAFDNTDSAARPPLIHQ